MSGPKIPIIIVVTRSDLDSSCPHLHVNIRVCHHGDGTLSKWMPDLCSMEFLVSRVVRMDSNSSVSQHCLWSSCRHHNLLFILRSKEFLVS